MGSLIACLGLLFLAISNMFSVPQWTTQDINRALSATIPTDATNIAIQGHRARGGFLELEFDAPPQSMRNFAGQLCNGVLYQGYDPFNAIDIAEPFTYTHPIHLDIYSYFSYSPDTPESVLGNRCMTSANSQLQIRINPTKPDLSHTKIDLRFSCEACHSTTLNIISITPEFPLRILGLVAKDNGYVLTGSELCVGFQLDAPYTPEKDWTTLVGAKLLIKLDNQAVATAALVDQSKLVQRTDAHGNVDVDTSGGPWYYCLKANLRKGLRMMETQVTASSGKTYAYSWQFQVN